MSAGQTTAADQAAWNPKVNPWIIAVVVSLASFMEVLDMSIANVALPHIAGNLGASNDESTWVLTTYLVANAIVLPISGFMVSLFGRKRFFLACIALFTASSFFCGMAPSIGLLLLFRVVQGAFGGGLQPMTQAILADSFPPKHRGSAFALYALTTIVAPILGPTLGGWITDNYSWRWIFYINVPVGAIVLLLVHQLLEDPPYLARAKKGVAKLDYVGFSLLAVGVGALQIMLDKGQEDDWFGSRFVTTLAVLTVVGLVSLVIWEWRQEDPIVDVRLYRTFNFATSNVMFLMLGINLFSTTVLMPQYLQTLMGYTAQKAGMVLTAGAMVMLIQMPIVGQLTNRVQARYLLAISWLVLSGSMYLLSRQTDLLMSFKTAAWLRVLQSFPLPSLFVPLTAAAYLGLPADKRNAAAGMMNFMRNMGQSIGTSAVTTIIARRTQYHQSVLAEHTSLGRFHAAIAGLASQLHRAGLSMPAAHQQALGRLYGLLRVQAAAISYVEAYWLLSVSCFIMFLASFFLRKNEPGGGEAVSVH